MLAPKEWDMMFIGGGIGGIWNSARKEALFYESYAEKDINRTALSYYRYERIVSDIAEFCQQILPATAGYADRERSLQKYSNFFFPGQVLEYACQTDQVNRRYFPASDYTIRVWRPDGSLAFTLNGHTQPVTGLAWSPGGKLIASGGSDSLVHLWSADGAPLGTLSGHTGAIRAVAWSPDGKILASGSEDKTVRLWVFKGRE